MSEMLGQALTAGGAAFGMAKDLVASINGADKEKADAAPATEATRVGVV
jgi:hypothetical protein